MIEENLRDEPIDVEIEEETNIEVEEENTPEEITIEVDDINYIPGYKEEEAQRRQNEQQRIQNEVGREAYINDLKQRVASGEFKGEKGDKGDQGEQGIQGNPGVDGDPGLSPTITTSKSGKTTTVTIVDAEGTKTATVLDGEDGANGQDGYTPIKGVDYFTQSDIESLDIPVIEYNSIYTFELSNKQRGIYVLANGNQNIKLQFNGVDKTDWFKPLDYTINVFKNYDDASDGEVFATLMAMTFNSIGGNWYIKAIGLMRIKKYNNNVLIEEDQKWGFQYASLTDASTISGKYTYTTLPESSVVPTTINQLVNKAYVDSNNKTLGIIPQQVYFDEIEPGIYCNSYQNVSFYETRGDSQFAYLPGVYNLIILKPYNESLQNGETFAVAYHVGNMRDGMTFTNFYKNSSGNLTRTNMQIAYLISPLQNSQTSINGLFIFKKAPQFNSTSIVPTNDVDIVNKKYVDDSVSAKQEVYVNQKGTSDEPFVLDGKKKGIYYFNCAYDTNTFYYKTKESENYKTFSGQVLYIEIFKDIDYDNAEEDEYLGRVINISNAYNGAVMRIYIRKRSTPIAGGSTLYTVLKDIPLGQTIYGKKIFDTLPESSGTPTTNNQLVNKAYVDANAGGGSISIIDTNNTTAENLAILQDFYDNFVDGKEEVFYFRNVSANTPCVMMTYQNGDNSTYADFYGYFLPNYQSTNYGISYNVLSKMWLRLSISNGEVTSYTNTSTSSSYLPLNTTDILGMNNTTSYTPTGDYNPATKKYVDDLVGDINTVLATLTIPSVNGGGN